PEQVLRIGSVTNTFAAAVVLQLAAEGSLGLDDALETWLPGFPGGAGITLRQMLNHTSGIFNYTTDPTWVATIQTEPMKVWTPQELVDLAAAHPPYFAPG